GRCPTRVIFTSPCACQGSHGVFRWAVKTETAQPPLFGIGVRKIRPADSYAWRGPEIIRSSPRIPAERKWYAVTGRVVRVEVEDDGDRLGNSPGHELGGGPGSNKRRATDAVSASRTSIIWDQRFRFSVFSFSEISR